MNERWAVGGFKNVERCGGWKGCGSRMNYLLGIFERRVRIVPFLEKAGGCLIEMSGRLYYVREVSKGVIKQGNLYCPIIRLMSRVSTYL